MKYQRYDLLSALYPFTDLSGAKRRPVVVLTDLEGDNLIACQITTKKHTFTKYLIPLPKNACEGDIRFDSFICTDLIATIHKSLIFKKLGTIQDTQIKHELDMKVSALVAK